VAAHLIAGLGESEQEMLRTVQRLHDHGIIVALFAFTPVRGTLLSCRLPPFLESYRRVQAGRWLIVHDRARVLDFAFSQDGQLLSLGRCAWRDMLASGDAFRTSGCPDCNRPFYNERPGGVTYNYARALTSDEAAVALNECRFAS
jgi:biotin synthase